jgi:hypothetical protein
MFIQSDVIQATAVQSMVGGLALLGRGEVLAACAACLGVNFLALLLAAPPSDGGGRAHGLSLRAAAAALVGGVSVSLLLSYILPVALVGAAATPLSLLLPKLGPIALVGALAAVVCLGGRLAPVLGRFLAPSPGAQLFVGGLVAFRFLTQDRAQELLPGQGAAPYPYPGLIASLGFIVLAWALARGIAWAAGLVAGGPGGGSGRSRQVAPALGLVGGLLALLMYCAYVRVALAG